MSHALDIAYALLRKTAGAGRAIATGMHAVGRTGNFLSKQLAEAGVESEAAHAAAKLAPWYGVWRAGKAVKDTDTVQRGLAKIRELRSGQEDED